MNDVNVTAVIDPILSGLTRIHFVWDPKKISSPRARIDAHESFRPVIQLIQLLDLRVAIVSSLFNPLCTALFQIFLPAEPFNPDSLDFFISFFLDLFNRLCFRLHDDLFIDANTVDGAKLDAIAERLAERGCYVRRYYTEDFGDGPEDVTAYRITPLGRLALRVSRPEMAVRL